MKTSRKIIDTLAVLVIVWQVVNVFNPPIVAHAGSAYGTPVCFYPASVTNMHTTPGTLRFMTTDPTQKLYFVFGKAGVGGLIAYDDGGPSNAALNKLFPYLVK